MTARIGLAVIALLIAAPALANDHAWRSFASDRTTVQHANVDSAYAEAIARICDAALAGYQEIYGIHMPERIKARVSLDPQQRLRLWTDGNSSIFLELGSERQLLPPAQSGVFNVYGLCHELGHMAIYRRMPNLMGMPEGVAEGFAHYFGSMVCGHVWDTLGEDAWPVPHNYYEYGGPGRFLRQMRDAEAARSNPESVAAYLLHEIAQRYGREALGKALEAVLATAPRGFELMPRFRDELVKATGDEEVAELFPASLLESRATFEGEPPRLDSLDSFRGLNVKADETGLLLYYDDDTMESKRSIGGGGHIIHFRTPEGKWRLDAAWLFGSRYGTPEPPHEDFSIFVCDAAMNLIAEVRKPYSLFERGPEKWVMMSFEPVEVPTGFHICLSFNPHQTKGIYVATDDSKPSDHSRVGLPYSRVGKLIPDYDWMIRAHITPENEMDLKEVAGEWGRNFAAD
ncbi:MAG: hypothetical protein JSV65_12400 [Armatimonadota bacterium]|nr:MAG: hypothetical protein JSV65_12400 [Armatimonadota bacterium]